jgi:hypothetical protein
MSTVDPFSARRPGLWRLVLGNLLVLAGLLVLLGVGGELYYRFGVDSTDSFGLTRVCQRWFQRHYQFNNFGLRDNVDYAMTRAPGARRVTFLGDSFTAGHGIANVEDRFANRVRAALGPGVEVHALAANGIDSGAEIQNLTAVVQGGYDLDTLVLVYVLNDVSDIVPQWGAILQRIYAESGREPFWVRHSYLINMLYYRLKAARDPDIANYYGFVRGAYEGELWEYQQERLRGLHALCRAKGARLRVVTFPLLNALGPDYAYADVHARLNSFWAGLGVPHLDLMATYEGRRARDLTIGRYDAHPNEEAHALAAEAILRFLEAQQAE